MAEDKLKRINEILEQGIEATGIDIDPTYKDKYGFAPEHSSLIIELEELELLDELQELVGGEEELGELISTIAKKQEEVSPRYQTQQFQNFNEEGEPIGKRAYGITTEELQQKEIQDVIKNFIDTPTNVVDDVIELENNIRSKYSDYLEKDTIRGYESSLENPFKADVPIYEKRGIQLNYFEGNPNANFPYNKDTLFINNLYIDETQRGQGIGSQIFDEIKKFADDNGLYIRLKNDKNFNTNFWEKKGFGIYEGDKSADYVIARLDDYVLAPKGETLPVTSNRLDTPGGSLGAAKLNDPLVFDSWIDNYANTTTSFVDNLPLSTTVKNQFNNIVQGRAKNLATPGGVADAVDVWELGVLGLMIAAVAYKEYDEIPTILTNKAVDMFNSMTSSYGIPPVPKEQYDLNYEFINKVVETGEKFMPTDIIIKKVGEVVKGAAETGAVTGFGYVPPNLTKTDTMETTQKIQLGVQEEKMFKKAKPQKGSGAGSGAKIL